MTWIGFAWLVLVLSVGVVVVFVPFLAYSIRQESGNWLPVIAITGAFTLGGIAMACLVLLGVTVGDVFSIFFGA